MAVDRGAIDAQLREIGEGERWWEQREFRDLPYVLHPDERILGLINGRLLGRRRPRVLPAGQWLFVATDQRLICLRQERFGRKQIDITPGHIVRVQQRSRFRSYQVTIETAERRYRIRVPQAEAFRFVGALAPLIPKSAARRLSPELEPLSWIPGIAHVAALPGVSGIVSRVAMLSPPDNVAHDRVARLEASVDRLQDEVERLQQQVAFLESLLENRVEASLLPGSGGDV